MDYYTRIQNAVEFIESHLQEDLKITEISSKAYFSAFHFQRLFQVISGFTVQEYIRKRRLTEAAKMLKETRWNILEIAASFQYGSQEAFTRAFVGCFGLSPAKYRKSDNELNLQRKINFLEYQNRNKGEILVNRPNIVNLNAIPIIGYEYKTNLNDDKCFEEIPGFYKEFGRQEYYLKIPTRLDPAMAYGIACNFEDDGGFSFIIGEQSQPFAGELEDGFVQFEIPEGKYAEFKHIHGQDTRQYIYGTWLPNSNYERREGPDFEVTNVLNSLPDNIDMKIYIPIK